MESYHYAERILTAHKLKLDRYSELQVECKENVWSCYNMAVEVGARGSWLIAILNKGSIQEARHKTVEFPVEFPRRQTVEFPLEFPQKVPQRLNRGISRGIFTGNSTESTCGLSRGTSTESSRETKPWNFLF